MRCLLLVACGPAGVLGVAWGRAALCARGRRPARLMALLVAPLVFRAPEGPAAREARRPHFVRRRASKPARALRSLRRPSHLWGRAAPWAAARPRAVRAASFARRVGSLSGQAPPPPTGTAAGPSGALHASGAWCAVGCLGASARCPARPRHRPRALLPGLAAPHGHYGGFVR